LERFDYKEAGPQLLLQAFLQRIVNSGGRVEREYGLGLRRTDLLIIWKVEDGSRKGDEREPQSVIQRAVIELKILRGSRERTIAEGLPQTWEYVDRCGAKEAHLVIFDRTPGKTWEEKLFRQEETYRERSITVWGM
jgi:hypothetical protein